MRTFSALPRLAVLTLTLTFAMTLTLNPWAAAAESSGRTASSAGPTRGSRTAILALLHPRKKRLACAAHSNGCSIPQITRSGFDEEIIRVVTPSCDRHDMCYACGRFNHVNRAQCDTIFLKEMLHTCKHLQAPPSTQHLCEGTAKTFFLGVSLFGSAYYRKSGQMPSYCPEVKHCIASLS